MCSLASRSPLAVALFMVVFAALASGCHETGLPFPGGGVGGGGSAHDLGLTSPVDLAHPSGPTGTPDLAMPTASHDLGGPDLASAVDLAAPVRDAGSPLPDANPPGDDGGTTAQCSDSVTSAAASGTVTIGVATDLVPLCDGWVLLTDRNQNQLVRRNVFTGAINGVVQLTSQPKRLALDAEADLVYVALSDGIAKIDLATFTLHPISGPNTDAVAVGNNGQVLGTALTATYQTTLFIYDGAGESLLTTLPLPYPYGGDLIVYDRARDRFVVADKGFTPAGAASYQLDPATLSVTLVQQVQDIGQNGIDLALSPDGSHFAFACGGGNDGAFASYVIADYRSDDFTLYDGYFNTGAYPTGAAFSVDGSRFAASNYASLDLFDADTKALVGSFTPPSGCEYGETGRVAFSRGSKWAFMLTPSCGFGNTGPGVLSFATVP